MGGSVGRVEKWQQFFQLMNTFRILSSRSSLMFLGLLFTFCSVYFMVIYRGRICGRQDVNRDSAWWWCRFFLHLYVHNMLDISILQLYNEETVEL